MKKKNYLHFIYIPENPFCLFHNLRKNTSLSSNMTSEKTIPTRYEQQM